MNNIPTAEKFLYNTLLAGISERRPNLDIKEDYAKQLSAPIPSKNYGKEKYGHDMQPHDTVVAMIEFAKLHVEAALKEASNNSKIHLKTYWADMENVTEEAKVFWGDDNVQNCYSTNVKVERNSILNAYPLKNIK